MFQSWMITKEKVILVWNDTSKYRLNSLVDISLYIVCWLSFTLRWFWTCWCESTLEMWAFQGHSVAEQSWLYLSSIMNANHSSASCLSLLPQEAVWGSGSADGWCDWSGWLCTEKTGPVVARIWLRGLEERQLGPWICGDGVPVWQTTKLHLYEGESEAVIEVNGTRVWKQKAKLVLMIRSSNIVKYYYNPK